MPAMIEHLSVHSVQMPNWLARYVPCRAPWIGDVLASRSVFYPGGAGDAHPIRLFASAHACHFFVYADLAVDVSMFREYCERLRGYTVLGVHDLTYQVDPTPKMTRREFEGAIPPLGAILDLQHATLAVLERRCDAGHHGPARIAVLYLQCDAYLAFDLLWRRLATAKPYGILLQDHGFGGNRDRFGAGGLLESIALELSAQPRWLVCAENTDPWIGFEAVQGVRQSVGGMHRNKRVLFQPNGLNANRAVLRM